MRNRAYVFPVNVSGAFLQLPSVSATLYLLVSNIMHRQYEDARKLMASLQTDRAFGKEESYTLGLSGGEHGVRSDAVETGLRLAFDGPTHPRDASPDFHACMLHLALALRYNPAKLPFKAD